jgi:cytoskeleton protein RodZ
MPTLGEELKRLREERNIPLADISEATRIGTRFLKAIENDNFSILPGGIFTRSFIRAYAKQVGMDEDEAVVRYQRQVSGSAPDASESNPAQPPAPLPAKRQQPVSAVDQSSISAQPRRSAPPMARTSAPPRNWARVIIGLVIVLFIGAVIFTLIRQLNAGSATSTPTRSTGNSEVSTASATPAKQAQASAEVTPRQPSQPEPDSQSTSGLRDSAKTLVVKLEASSGDSWIRYQVDDADPTSLTLRQGQVQVIPAAQNQIRLHYGNRETLKLTINNRAASFPPDTPKFASQVVISRETLESFFQ